LTQRGKASYREKLAAQDKLDAGTKDFHSVLVTRLGIGPYRLVFTLLITLVVVYYAGQSAALRQSTYLVTSTSPQMVVLRTYGDSIICARFDRNTKEVEPSFVVLKVGDDPELTLHSEHVGPLSLHKQSSNVTDSPLQPPMPTSQP
jgi:hypothetical protein